jgi:hypothetical protein
MRDFIIFAVICLLSAFVADRGWLEGKYTGDLRREWLLDFSSINRRYGA